MFGGIKDVLASSAAKSFIAGRLERYAKVSDLRIHSRERSITVDFLLEGEEVPVRVECRYRIGGSAGKHVLVVEAVGASRAWLGNLLEDVVVGKPLPVPSVALLALGGSQD